MSAKPPRLTVRENVYHELPDIEPEGIDESFSLQLNNLEEVYKRKTFAKPEAAKLDTGWIETAACLLVRNIAKVQSKTVPSKEELEELSKKIIRVFYDDDPRGFLLAPGESLRVRPTFIKELMIQSQSGNIPYSVFIVPE